MTKKLFNKQGAIFIAAGFLLCFSFKAFAEEKEKAARNKNEALYQNHLFCRHPFFDLRLLFCLCRRYLHQPKDERILNRGRISQRFGKGHPTKR